MGEIDSGERKGTGLYCFINPNRACGPECMAYENAPSGKDFLGKQWANCLLLVNVHRTGKHLTILAGSVDSLVVSKQDEARRLTPLPAVR